MEVSYFLTNETLGSCPFLSSKLDSPVINAFFTLSESPMFFFITEYSDFDERNEQKSAV
jgi:hypothetical protein